MKYPLCAVGLGPGDPELLTLAAVERIEAAEVLVGVQSVNGASRARQIIAKLIKPGQIWKPLELRFDQDRANHNAWAYEAMAIEIADMLAAKLKVAVLCEGDPLFYGSYIYLHANLRLAGVGPEKIEIIPGITSIHAASAAAKLALARKKESWHVITGDSSDKQITTALRRYANLAIIKVGGNGQRIIEIINKVGRKKDSVFAAEIGNQNQQIIYSPDKLPPSLYFSLFLLSPN